MDAQKPPADQSAVWTMWPVSPMYLFFVLVFIALGVWFILAAGTDATISSEDLGWPIFAGGLIFVYAGVVLAVSFVRVHKWGLLAMGPVIKKKRRGYGGSLIPRWHVTGFGKMAKASMQMVSAGRGSACVLLITLKDGRIQIINLGPYTRKNCRKLVLWMRARGVDTSVQTGLLGRGFK
jgi:hypothetical protein